MDCLGFNTRIRTMIFHLVEALVSNSVWAGFCGWRHQRILDEITGCVLLCACYHAAVHSGELELRSIA